MKKLIPLLFLTGCMVGPDYQVPETCLPSQYEEAPVEREEMDLTSWWKQFDDPLLTEYIQVALTCNFDLQIALHRIEEVRGLYHIERSALYPQIEANMVATRDRRSENLSSAPIEDVLTPAEFFPGTTGPLIQNFFQIGFDASWELDFFGKNRRRAEAGFRDFQASQEEALFVQISLISDIARSYIDIRSLQHQIKAKIEQIERQQDLVDLAKTRYCAGLTSYLDVARAQAELRTQESGLPPLEEGLKQTIHGLAILLGRPPEKFSVSEGELPLALGRIPPELPSDLLCRRPDIRQAERELAAATSRIGVAKAELFPSFSLIGTFGTQSNDFNKIFVWPSRFWTIGPNMIWNLFTGGKLVNQVKVQNERQKQAILNYERAINDALKDVEDRLVGYFKEQSRFEVLQERLDTRVLERELTLDQYFNGLISFDDVLDAEKNFFQSKEEMIQSEGILMIQLIGLYKALGGGWQCCDLL